MNGLKKDCGIEIFSLPRAIETLGDVKPEDLEVPGLLYLPNPYVVPGGRFNEMYGWDSYFIVVGLQDSGEHALARGMVDNFLFEIEHYGGVLNANRTYYLTRSQPPYLTCMMRALHEGGHTFADSTEANRWLGNAYRLATKYYSTWTAEYRAAGDTGLARYYDVDCGPVPELADDTRYFHDVIDWLLAHRSEDRGYLITPAKNRAAQDSTKQSGGGKPDCDPKTGVAHEPAMVDGYGLSADFYLGDRAMRESGYDSSFRFGPFCGSTHHYAPVCLNSLLYRYERDMAHFAEILVRNNEKRLWNLRAEQRAEAIQKYSWQEDDGLFMDYDFVKTEGSRYAYLTAYFPMWAGIATAAQAQSLRSKLPLFEREGGLAMSATKSGMQWDEPYGWAPSNWMVVEGLLAYGYREDARRIARAFMDTIDHNFEEDSTVREKYDVVARDREVHVTAGYKENVIGFGWTNAVYLKMRELLAESR